MNIDCDRCGREMSTSGALVFGPPGLFPASTVEKLHVCLDCWPAVRSSVMHHDPVASRAFSAPRTPEGTRDG